MTKRTNIFQELIHADVKNMSVKAVGNKNVTVCKCNTGIPMGTNCAPLLADLFLYSYESECLQKLVKDKKIHEARAFNFTFRYIVVVNFIGGGNQSTRRRPLTNFIT
jgi:hypothetical protein